jgi:hypothetical protein
MARMRQHGAQQLFFLKKEDGFLGTSAISSSVLFLPDVCGPRVTAVMNFLADVDVVIFGLHDAPAPIPRWFR